MRKIKEKKTREKFFLKMFVGDKRGVTEEEVEYFKNHPDEIDEITAPLNVHKMFLLFGALLGVMFVGFSHYQQLLNLIKN